MRHNDCAKRIDVIFELSPDLMAVACQNMMGKHYAVAIQNRCGNNIEVCCHFYAGNCCMKTQIRHIPSIR